MAGNDTAALVVALSAQLTKFEKDMSEAGNIADRGARNIEKRFAQINPGVAGIVGRLAIPISVAGFLEGMRQAVSEVAKLGETAERVGVSTDALQKFRFAVKETGGTAAAADEGLQKFGRNVSEAARGTGELAKVLVANNIALKDFAKLSPEDQLKRYADLVRNAKNPQDALNLSIIATGRSAGPDMVNALRLGSAGLDAHGKKLEEIGGILDKEFVEKARAIQKQWDEVTTIIGVKLKSAFIDVAQSISDIKSAGSDLIDIWTNKASVTQLQNQIAWVVEQLEIARKGLDSWNPIDQIGAGAAIKLLETYLASLEKKLNAVKQAAKETGTELETGLLRPGEQGSGPDGPPTIIPREEDAVDKFIKSSNRRRAAMEAEIQTIGQGVFAEEQLKIQLELETIAKDNNIKSTDELRQRIAAASNAYAAMAEKVALARQQFEQFQALQNFLGQSLISFFNDIVTGSGKASDALRKLALSFLNAAQQALILGQGPLAGLFGTAAAPGTGNIGGLIGALFRGIGGAATGVPGAAIDPWAGLRASGGPVNAGMPYLVGERGPETFVPSVPGHIVPAGAGGGITVVINSRPVFQAGMTATDMAAINSALDKNKYETRDLTINAIRESMRRDSRTLQGAP